MAPHSRAFEASLLFPGSVSSDPARLAEDIATIAEAHGQRSRRLPTDTPAYQLFDCGEVQILVAGCDTPLTVAHFLDSARPAAAMLHETAVLARLTRHQYSITVLVADRPEAELAPDPARDELKERLCWQVTEALRDRYRAFLVFWCDNDTLYAGEEFGCAGPMGENRMPPRFGRPATLEEAEIQFDMQRMLEAKAMTFIQTQIIQGAHRRPLRRVSMLARVAELDYRLQAATALETAKEHGHQMLRGTTMACSSAAIGICTMPALTTIVFG